MARLTGFRSVAFGSLLLACGCATTARPPQPSFAEADSLVCREVLGLSSNVIQRLCKTGRAWTAWDKSRAAQAERVTRSLQGSAYDTSAVF